MDFNALPKVVAIVGSRRFPHKHWIDKCVDSLNPGTIVVSGGARGVDSWVEERAKQRKDIYFKGFNVENFEWSILGKVAGFARNYAMLTWVRWHDGCAIIFALKTDIDAKKGGSYDDIRVCEKLGIPYTLYAV